MFKICGECNLLVEIENFAIDKTKRDGLNARCKGCKNFHDRTCYHLAKMFPKPSHGVCAYCLRQNGPLEQDHDHKIAERSGFINPAAHLAWCCRSCNNKAKFPVRSNPYQDFQNS